MPKTWSSIEAQNKPAALITEQFPKLCNNNSMPTADGGRLRLESFDIWMLFPYTARSIQNEAAFQKTTEGAFV